MLYYLLNYTKGRTRLPPMWCMGRSMYSTLPKAVSMNRTLVFICLIILLEKKLYDIENRYLEELHRNLILSFFSFIVLVVASLFYVKNGAISESVYRS